MTTTNDFSQYVYWRKIDPVRVWIFHVCCVLTAGLLPLFTFYFPNLRMKCRTVECPSTEAEYVQVVFQGNEYIVEIKHYNNVMANGVKEHGVVMELDCIRYCASSLDNYTFHRVPDVPRHFHRFLDVSYETRLDGKSIDGEDRILSIHYGSNQMSIPEATFLEVGIRHMLSPFYIFQYFSAAVWFSENYWVYALLIVIITFSAIYLTTKETMFNLESLRMLAGAQGVVQRVNHKTSSSNKGGSNGFSVQVAEDGILLPGYKFLVEEGMTLPCDAVLVSGKVVVDESMLTGESIPVSKTPLDAASLLLDEATSEGKSEKTSSTAVDAFTLKRCSTKGMYVKEVVVDPYTTSSRNNANDSAGSAPTNDVDLASKKSGSVLFGGTKVKACYGDNCIAVVYRTSFRSAKGQLVASLLQPKHDMLTFVSDAIYVLLLMFFVTIIIFIYISYELSAMGATSGEVALHFFDAITIAVPPALTACLTVATAISISRLRLGDIFVSDTSRVNYAGMIQAVCFDKTGTLTENTLRLDAVFTIDDNETNEEMIEYRMQDENNQVNRDIVLPFTCQLIMATCHSLSILPRNFSSTTTSPGQTSQIRGDPLEEELLTASKWSLANSAAGQNKTASAQQQGVIIATPPASASTYSIIRHFEFTPDKLRAGSLVQESNGTMHYVLKGSPEVILDLLYRKSTDGVPVFLKEKLSSLAKGGYRVIATAYHRFTESSGVEISSLSQLRQEDIENSISLQFGGLLCLSSGLKADTTTTIEALHRANLHVNMITGDHVQTAICIASMCHILQFASPHADNATATAHATDRSVSITSVTSTKHKRRTEGRSLYIIDEDAETGDVIIVDAMTDKILSSEVSLGEVILETAKTCLYDLYLHSLSAAAVNVVIEGEEEDVDVETGNSTVVNPIAAAAAQEAPRPNPVSTVVVPRFSTCIELAVTGKGLQAVKRQYSKAIFQSLVRYAKIFARMKPHDKKVVVETLKASTIVDIVRVSEDHFRTMRGQGSGSKVMFNLSPTLLGGWTSREGGVEMVLFVRLREIFYHIQGFYTNGSGLVMDSSYHPPVSSGPVNPFTGTSLNPPMHKIDDVGVDSMEVMFCGDGANDMIALRAATVGVSLCDAETSVAAPVTSKLASPSATVAVLREGRASLITAYVLIMFNIMYAMIQLMMATLLYHYGLIAGDYMYLIQDLFFTLVLGLAISYTKPCEKLSSTLPPSRFLTAYFMSRLAMFLLCFILFQILALWILSLQSFYNEYETDDPLKETYSYESSVIDTLALAQLMMASYFASIGKPFRESWYTNHYHLSLLGLQSIWVLFQVFTNTNPFAKDFLQLKSLPVYFGFLLLTIMLLNFICCMGIKIYCDRYYALRGGNGMMEGLQCRTRSD